MKRYITIILLGILLANTYGQGTSTKIFYDEMNSRCDSSEAASIVVITKPNPLKEYELVEQYSIDGNLIGRYEFSTTMNWIRNGKSEDFFPNGNLKIEKHYKKNQLDGELRSYYLSGEIRRIETYKKGQFRKGKCYTKAGQDTTFYPYFVMPTYKDGNVAMSNFLNENIIYPELAIEEQIQGKVIVRMIITEEGNVKKPIIKKGLHPLLEEEALRIAYLTDLKWNPGLKDNQKVQTNYDLTVNFSLK